MTKRMSVNYSRKKISSLHKNMNGYVETVEILSNPKMRSEIEESIKQYKENRLLSIKGFDNA